MLPELHSDALDRHVGYRLTLARRNLNIAQAKAARTLRLNTAELQLLEQGEKRLTAICLHQAANLYQRPVLWFFWTGDDLDR